MNAQEKKQEKKQMVRGGYQRDRAERRGDFYDGENSAMQGLETEIGHEQRETFRKSFSCFRTPLSMLRR